MSSEGHKVVMFRPYPFKKGQKINIESGPRRGDWEVIGVSDKKVKLKCPVSFRVAQGIINPLQIVKISKKQRHSDLHPVGRLQLLFTQG